jgi:hypothetical protein
VSSFDAQMTSRNFQLLRVPGFTLRMKAQADSSSKDQRDFICREEKRKDAWGACSGIQKLVVPWVRLEIGFL